jgi:hypothetical protein
MDLSTIRNGVWESPPFYRAVRAGVMTARFAFTPSWTDVAERHQYYAQSFGHHDVACLSAHAAEAFRLILTQNQR